MLWRFRIFLLILLAAATASAQTREGFLNVPGGPVYYRVEGAGNGTPILMVHGGPGGTSCSFLALGELAAGRRLVLYDQLGSGRSGRPRDPKLWTLERSVEELDAVRRQLGLKRVHLLGHSWGGAVVAQYALSKGTRGLESLILASPLLSTPDWLRDAELLRLQLPPDVQATLRKHEAAGTTNSEEYRLAEREFNRRFLARKARSASPDCAGSVFNPQIYEFMWGPSEFHATGTLRSFDLNSQLPRLRLPVLLMVGEFDEARPETARKYQQVIPGAQLAVIPGAAHATWNDNHAAVLAALRNFLSALATRASKDKSR